MSQVAELANDQGFVLVDTVDGVAVAGIGLPSLRERQAVMMLDKLRQVAGRHGGRLAVSLTEVIDLNSACINALVEVHRHCRELGGQIVVFGLRPQLRKLFHTTGIDKILPVADDCEQAVKVFARAGRWSPFRKRGRDAA